MVGHTEVVDAVLTSLFCGATCCSRASRAWAKLLVRTLAQSLSLPFSRIQFTPALMPADVIGTNIVMEDPDTGRRKFEFQQGPIFAQVVLADEINRATPKTQSALLEAMQERSVTVAGVTYKLQQPFIVLATQNPIEQEGTYPLPEAQLDRFIFKINVGYSQLDDLMTILDRTTAPARRRSDPCSTDRGSWSAASDPRRGRAPHVKEYAARLCLATHPEGRFAAGGATGPTNKYVRCGASPRAAQALILGAKVRAVTDGRYHVSYADLRAVALLCLRHRVLLNFEAEADRISQDDVVNQILELTPTEPVGLAAGAR